MLKLGVGVAAGAAIGGFLAASFSDQSNPHTGHLAVESANAAINTLSKWLLITVGAGIMATAAAVANEQCPQNRSSALRVRS